MSSAPSRRSNRGKKPEESASNLPKESGVRGASGNAQRVLRSGKNLSKETGNNVPTVPTPSGSPASPKKNVNYTHWKRGKVVQSGVNDLSKDVAASASNPIYQQKYGHLESDDNLESDNNLESDADEDDDYRGHLSEDEGGDDDDDDDDDFVDIDPESDDEGRSSFPKNKTLVII